MSTHKCTPPPYTRKLLCRKNEMERAEHSKPHHRHGWVLEQQTAISLGTCHPHGLRWGKPEKPGKSCQAKFSHMHLFNLLHSHLKIAILGQTWDKPGLSKTFHWQEGSLLGMSPLPNKLDGAPLLVLGAAVWGCPISGCRETPFSTGPHTLSAPLLSYPAGVGCKSVSVSVRSLNFQQWWFKAQFSHSCSATERSFNMATGPRGMAVTLGVPKGIPGCDRC